MNFESKFNVIALDNKIDKLFSSRYIIEQCEQADFFNFSDFIVKIKELQVNIYRLDKYFEWNWKIKQEDIAIYWKYILKSINNITHEENADFLAHDIFAYQQLEEAIRYPSLTSIPSLYRYYYLKTCDIQLIRNLIVKNAKAPHATSKDYIQSWILFDLLSEIYDDLIDIDEDLSTFNGNRFLIGVTLIGASSTIDDYLRFKLFLSKNITELQNRISLQHPAHLPLACAVKRLAEIQSLVELLKNNIEYLNNISLDSALSAARNTMLCTPTVIGILSAAA